MSDPTSPADGGTPDVDVPFGPDPDGSAEARASELVLHGLLEFHRSDDRAARPRRVQRVLSAIACSRRSNPWASLASRPLFRWTAAAAALGIVCFTLLRLGVPGESSALAEVRRSIEAMKQGGDRRYEVTLHHTPGGPPSSVNAVIDTRPPSLLLIRHKPPWAQGLIAAGHDAEGAWATTRDGAVTRESPERYWPPFVNDGGGTIILNSIDELLAALPTLYTLKKAPAAAIEGGDGRVFERISAERQDRRGPRPHTIELWIDPATHIAERFEYHWDADEGPGGRGGPPLSMVVFQRVEAPDLAPDWFSPAGHKAPQ